MGRGLRRVQRRDRQRAQYLCAAGHVDLAARAALAELGLVLDPPRTRAGSPRRGRRSRRASTYRATAGTCTTRRPVTDPSAARADRVHRPVRRQPGGRAARRLRRAARGRRPEAVRPVLPQRRTRVVRRRAGLGDPATGARHRGADRAHPDGGAAEHRIPPPDPRTRARARPRRARRVRAHGRRPHEPRGGSTPHGPRPSAHGEIDASLANSPRGAPVPGIDLPASRTAVLSARRRRPLALRPREMTSSAARSSPGSGVGEKRPSASR